MANEPVEATMLVIHALDQLSVPYVIGGSLASAVHGVVRATMDTDIVADLHIEHAQPLADALSGTFYADVDMIQDAIEHHGSFNLIHLKTMFKVDVFIFKSADAHLRLFRQTQRKLPLSLPRKIPSSPNWNGIAWEVKSQTVSGAIFSVS